MHLLATPMLSTAGMPYSRATIYSLTDTAALAQAFSMGNIVGQKLRIF